MEVSNGSSRSNGKPSSESSTSTNGVHKAPAKDVSDSVFVNRAAIAWNEIRKKWIGDQSQQPQKIPKDQIISWSTTYDELLSTNEPFSERIPLPEMVDFLVDIWHDEGLFD
ncbi:hypothetical protein Tsubulata_020214 [Turnera subulata]|uniref:Gag1-like clamp domain-containing protein n=1 Tax=Turnera subulata TaxID=218843 RepID=A0A9Q0J9R2_9ROSI|nr:hypothetical protein Tsubulata_020214 [Turnera subulata]